MNAPAHPFIAAPAFTAEQLLAIIGTCDVEMGKRQSPEPWQYAAQQAFSHHLSDVRHLAFGVLEGQEEAADLQAALEAIDFHPLWQAAAVKVAA